MFLRFLLPMNLHENYNKLVPFVMKNKVLNYVLLHLLKIKLFLR
jgi:hypothetical protein